MEIDYGTNNLKNVEQVENQISTTEQISSNINNVVEVPAVRKITVGNVTTEQVESDQPANVDISTRTVEKTEYMDFDFEIPKGKAGPYFTPTVDNEGNLSWTNNGDLVNPETVNIKGPQGPQGPQGPAGDAGTFDADFSETSTNGLQNQTISNAIIRRDVAQTLTDAEKQQAQTNMTHTATQDHATSGVQVGWYQVANLKTNGNYDIKIKQAYNYNLPEAIRLSISINNRLSTVEPFASITQLSGINPAAFALSKIRVRQGTDAYTTFLDVYNPDQLWNTTWVDITSDSQDVVVEPNSPFQFIGTEDNPSGYKVSFLDLVTGFNTNSLSVNNEEWLKTDFLTLDSGVGPISAVADRGRNYLRNSMVETSGVAISTSGWYRVAQLTDYMSGTVDICKQYNYGLSQVVSIDFGLAYRVSANSGYLKVTSTPGFAASQCIDQVRIAQYANDSTSYPHLEVHINAVSGQDNSYWAVFKNISAAYGTELTANFQMFAFEPATGTPTATKVISVKGDVNVSNLNVGNTVTVNNIADTNGNYSITPSQIANRSGKYSTLKSGGSVIVDTRSVNSPPSYYANQETCYEFKSTSVLGLTELMPSEPYVTLKSVKGWTGDNYTVYQEAVCAGNDLNALNSGLVCYRYGVEDTWGEWQIVGTKLPYEYTKKVSFGESGYLYIGKFPVYDTNITVDISCTTSTTYSGKLVIACQNSKIMKASVFGDYSNMVTAYTALKLIDNTVEVYFIPQAWSKNIIHITCCGIQGNVTHICEKINATLSIDGALFPTNEADDIDSTDSGYGSNNTYNYIRYKNGLQICWGRVNTGDYLDVTFPVPFINTNYTALDSPIYTKGTSSGYGYCYDFTTTSFKVIQGNSSQGSWFAIGRWK